MHEAPRKAFSRNNGLTGIQPDIAATMREQELNRRADRQARIANELALENEPLTAADRQIQEIVEKRKEMRVNKVNEQIERDLRTIQVCLGVCIAAQTINLGLLLWPLVQRFVL